jgi:hypothetical protein
VKQLSTRELLRRLVESPQLIVHKYPVSNTVWDFDTPTGTFVTEASQLGLSRLDPWNRPIPDANLVPLRNAEGEVYAWRGMVTVAGEQVVLTIFNS